MAAAMAARAAHRPISQSPFARVAKSRRSGVGGAMASDGCRSLRYGRWVKTRASLPDVSVTEERRSPRIVAPFSAAIR